MRRLKLGTSKLARSCGLPRRTIKPHPEKKWKWPWAREAPKYWGFPLIFLQRPRCPLSVSGATCCSCNIDVHFIRLLQCILNSLPTMMMLSNLLQAYTTVNKRLIGYEWTQWTACVSCDDILVYTCGLQTYSNRLLLQATGYRLQLPMR